MLQGPAGPVRHVIEITFDNVHFTRDNPYVPSDLEQIPSLLNFIKQDGTLLSNEHTPLIAHTADDILTTLTGVYGSTHGQPVANDYRTYNTTSGSSDRSSSFAYWTDPVTNAHATDTAPTMDDNGEITPAPWVPFTRAGCDVGAFATANMEIEISGMSVPGFASFFSRLADDGITAENTLFIFSSDEGDHFAGTQNPTPSACDGVTTFCAYPKGTIGELAANVTGLLAEHDAGAPTDYQIEADTAPNFYLNGDPAPGGTDERTLEQDLGSLKVPDPYTTGGSVNFTNYLADKTEENILHMVTADPERTPTFTDFANPDLYVSMGSSTCTPPSSSSSNSAASDSCVMIDPAYAWDHGDVAPEINTNWVGFVGPGVALNGVDSTTWADETDVRPTLMALTGLKDDYEHAGRVLYEDLTPPALPPAMHDPNDRYAFFRLGQSYKQLEASVGEFGMATLQAATIGLESTSTTTYSTMESELTALGSQRDTLASTIEGDLEGVEFGGGSLSASQANSLNTQAQSLISQAEALPGSGV